MITKQQLEQSALSDVEIVAEVGVTVTSEVGYSVFITNEMLDALIAERQATLPVYNYYIYGEDADGSERKLTMVVEKSALAALALARSQGFLTATEAVKSIA